MNIEKVAKAIEADTGQVMPSLRESLRQAKHGEGRVVYSPVIGAREKTGLSQTEFAALLGVSPRTLQDWEQGRRQPTGAAKTLLRVAAAHPRVLLELDA
jgi:putative transcriptional regulator